MSTVDVPEADILTLIGQGLTNAEIARRTGAGRARVGRIRRAHGIPDVSQAEYRGRIDHPQGRLIRLLLDEGYTNAEIHRRTGAATDTVRRYRRLGKFGPATILPDRTRRHRKHDAIVARLGRATNIQIAAELGVDKTVVSRIRVATGIQFKQPRKTRSVTERWAEHLVLVDGGHMEWNGPRYRPGGSPTLRIRGRCTSPARLGFEWANGRAPVGSVLPECGYRGCLTPDHLDDAAGRTEVRLQVRYLLGKGEVRDTCTRGHVLGAALRLQPDGSANCAICRRDAEGLRRTRGRHAAA